MDYRENMGMGDNDPLMESATPHGPILDFNRYLDMCNDPEDMEEEFSLENEIAMDLQEMKDYKPHSHIISTSRLKRILRYLQNVTKSVAIHVLESLEDVELFKNYEREFKEWKIFDHAMQLYELFNTSNPFEQNDTMDTQLSAKKRKICHIDDGIQREIEIEREMLRELLADYLNYIQQQEATAYDDMVVAVIESFKYHTSLSLNIFQKSLAKNRYNYSLYFYCMEIFRQRGQKLDCIKMLRYGQYLCSSEIGQVEMEINVELSRMSEQLGYAVDMNNPEIKNNTLMKALTKDYNELKATELIFKGLIIFFSDGPQAEMMQLFEGALAYDKESIFAYCNIGVMRGFNPAGQASECLKGIETLKKALKYCTVREKQTLASFLHHTIAQIYLRLNSIEHAITHVDKSLNCNPSMILAFFDRADIFKSIQDMDRALYDNDFLLNLKPESPTEVSNLYCSRAMILYKLNKEDEMLEALRNAIDVDATNSLPFIMLSKYALKKNDLEQFESLKNRIKLREQTHITHFLQYLIEAYSYLRKDNEALFYSERFKAYNNSWFRID